jgi:hypothetical protein
MREDVLAIEVKYDASEVSEGLPKGGGDSGEQATRAARRDGEGEMTKLRRHLAEALRERPGCLYRGVPAFDVQDQCEGIEARE